MVRKIDAAAVGYLEELLNEAEAERWRSARFGPFRPSTNSTPNVYAGCLKIAMSAFASGPYE